MFFLWERSRGFLRKRRKSEAGDWFFPKKRNERNSLRRCACPRQDVYFFIIIQEYYVRSDLLNLKLILCDKWRRSNREKVVGKRKGKNWARKERKFFLWERSRGFLRKRRNSGAGDWFFLKKIGTSVTRSDDLVETTGLEPATSRVWSERSPSWAKPPI